VKKWKKSETQVVAKSARMQAMLELKPIDIGLKDYEEIYLVKRSLLKKFYLK